MAQRSLFMNSAPGDPRRYTAQDIASYYKGVFSNGIMSNGSAPVYNVSVQAGTMNTIVSPGQAIINGFGAENTENVTLAHPLPEPDLDRIDRVVLRMNLSADVRKILLFVKPGTPSADPQPPALQRDQWIWELSFAQVRVRQNTVQLLPEDLIDERLITDLCGIVTLNPQIPTDNFQSQWDAFMSGLIDDGFVPMSNYERAPNTGKTTNVGNAYSVTMTPAPLSYSNMMGIVLEVNADSTGPATVNVNGMGVKPLLKIDGTPITNLKKNGIYPFRYSVALAGFAEQGGGGEDLTELINVTNAAERNEDSIRTNVAVAVSNKGVPTASDAPWFTIEQNINKLDTSPKYMGGSTAPTNGNLEVRGLPFKPRIVQVTYYNSSTTTYALHYLGTMPQLKLGNGGTVIGFKGGVVQANGTFNGYATITESEGANGNFIYPDGFKTYIGSGVSSLNWDAWA